MPLTESLSGVQLLALFPTALYSVSIVAAAILHQRVKKSFGTVLEGREERLSEEVNRNFRLSIFLESLVLAIGNGLIITFELTQTEFGISLLLVGVLVSFLGLITTIAENDNGVSLMYFFLFLLFLYEFVYFSLLDTAFDFRGVLLTPALTAGLLVVGLVGVIVVAAIITGLRNGPITTRTSPI